MQQQHTWPATLCSVLSVVKTHQADSLPSFHLLLATHGAGGKPKQGQRLRLPTSYFIPLNHHLGSPLILQPHKQDGAIKEVRNLKGFSLLPKTATAESPQGWAPPGPGHAGAAAPVPRFQARSRCASTARRAPCSA